MTNVVIRYNSEGEFSSLTTEGHANSARQGEDLVCSAISAVILGGINALQGKNFSLDVDQKKGNISLQNTGKMTEHDSLVIEVIVSQLQAIARDNPKYLKISM